jgi:predicted  nucleic acid-binding Zn-ribbon protein
MTYQQPASESSGSPILRAIGGVLRFLVRFIFVLIVGALIGAGLYFGLPWAYRSLVQPVQRNSARVAALEQRVAQEQTRLQDENLALQERIASLEAKMPALEEESAVLSQGLEEAETQIDQLEQSLTQVEADLEAQRATAEAARSRLEGTVTDLDEQTAQVAQQTEALEGRLALLQTAQDLLKVRLLLLEENARDARDTLTLATVHLEQAMALMPGQAEKLLELQGRMTELDGLIEERSFRAGPELESLWADVIDLIFPATVPPAGPTPTPAPTP